MNLPHAVPSDSVQLDAKGKDVLLECYADGEILFWTDDGTCLEFDRKNAALIIAALRKQDKLPKPPKGGAAELLPFQRAPRAPASQGISTASHAHQVKHKEPNRAVSKEALGWGATVMLGGNAVRYYYDKRDNARAASPSHKIGDSGRVA